MCSSSLRIWGRSAAPFGGGPADLATNAVALMRGRVVDGEGLDTEARGFEAGFELGWSYGEFGGDEDEGRGLMLLDAALEEAESGEGEIAEDGGDGAEDELAAAEAEADNGRKPESGGGGHADDHVVFLNDGAGADEADAGEDAKGEAHEVHDGVGVVRLAVGGEKEVHLDHGDGGGHGDQESGASPAGWPLRLRSMPSAVPAMTVSRRRSAMAEPWISVGMMTALRCVARKSGWLRRERR